MGLWYNVLPQCVTLYICSVMWWCDNTVHPVPQKAKQRDESCYMPHEQDAWSVQLTSKHILQRQAVALKSYSQSLDIITQEGELKKKSSA